MKMLTEEIYYADKEILDIIKFDFDLIDNKGWYQLYQYKEDKTYWRLDKWDKHQVQIFVRLISSDNWPNYDDTELRISLLQTYKGVDSSRKCIWKDCERPTLKGLVFCERHAYLEMEIRQ